MKTFVLAGLVAAAAALPQYGGSPCKSKRTRSSHTSAATTAADKLALPTDLASIVNGIIPYATGSGSASIPSGTAPSYTSTEVVTSTKHIESTVYVGTVTTAGTDVPKKTTSALTTAAAATKSSNHASTSAVHSTPSQSGATASSSSASSNSTTGTAAASSDFLRGINIGNWLILEKWMDSGKTFTGDFSSAPDQYTFDGLAGAEAALNQHWSTWFTKSDVEQISSYGFNALRIPIGFWAYDNSGTPYQTGADVWLDEAISWAREYNMKVLVDCHGSPGSQNGKVHSGHTGSIEWQTGNNLNKSTEILVTMAKKYGAASYSDVIWGIEMVNEPQAGSPNSFSTSQSWAKDAYSQMYDAIENKDLRIITHDSFMGPTKFTSIAQKLIATSPQQNTFGVDQHNYQLYTDEDNALDQAAHIQKACGWAGALNTAKSSMPTIVGEWSALTNICALSDGTTVSEDTGCPADDSGCTCASSTPSKWSDNLVTAVRKYTEAQLEVYEQNSDGYFLWSWKGPGGWGVTGPASVGAFPTHVVNDRKYSNLCGSS